MVALLPPQRFRSRLRRRGGGSGVSAGRLEELQGAQVVPAAALLGRRHPEEMEAFLQAQVFGGHDAPGGVEGLQGEEPLPSDLRQPDAASGAGEGLRGSPQVSEG